MHPISGIGLVRLRPGMFVGTTDHSGLLWYLATPIMLILREPTGATWLNVSETDAGYVIESDGEMRIGEADGDTIDIFEAFEPRGKCGDAVVLNAFSEYLDVEASSAGVSRKLRFERGVRKFVEEGGGARTRTRLAFSPDPSIFESTRLPAAMIGSFLRRLSYQHPAVRFRFSGADGANEYHAPGGITELFAAMSAPVQLVTTPLSVRATEGSLRLELIFAYHSWTQNSLWCFINKFRTVRGGTHEKGLADAFEKLPPLLGMKPDRYEGYNGVVAVMSVDYPEAVKAGSRHECIGNPELRDMVSRLVVSAVLEQVAARPDVARELSRTWMQAHPESNFI
ncbi:DNA topoisomerase 4 subunit B [Aquisphaera giovannonii]|uniref:DNA topoisomerase (ATP-hydrolyzing) n=1 Tax=Aquisphaera giovannonii TaxID=406548 RepID=A0A5B9WER1_9BACT|nr:hypothetical protein [Aquisphaera giovannonii]QEH38370.1 DNA topoisomerase 4 subunit B [Aquisphaera giovannonii]